MVMMTIDMRMRIFAFRLLATEKVTFIDQDSMILLYLSIEREEKKLQAEKKELHFLLYSKMKCGKTLKV